MDRKSFVYIIGSVNGPYKVGISGSPRKRMAALQTGSPVPLSIHATAISENPRYDEDALHRALAPYRQAGEWFGCALSTILMAFKNQGLAAIDDPGALSIKAAPICSSPRGAMPIDVFRTWLIEMSQKGPEDRQNTVVRYFNRFAVVPRYDENRPFGTKLLTKVKEHLGA